MMAMVMAHGARLRRVRRRPARGLAKAGGPGAIRTRDTRFRRAVLYPLSYWALQVRAYIEVRVPEEAVRHT